MTAAGPPHRDDDRLEGEIVLLVDGALPPERARRLDAEAAERPELAARIARTRAGRELVREAAASVEASWDLRRAVEALHDDAGARPGAARRWAPFAWLGGVTAAGVVALVLVLSGGGPGVDQVIALAERAPVAAVSAGGGPLLADEVEGVRFPDYAEKFGWRAVGRREDEVDGREVTTVVYERGGRRVSYSIVAGEPLDEPEGEDLEAEGTRLRRVGGDSVTWLRQGHTCVLTAGDGVPTAELAELAGWTAKGEVPF